MDSLELSEEDVTWSYRVALPSGRKRTLYPIRGGRPAARVAGVRAAGGEQRRAHRAGVRPRRGCTDLLIIWPHGGGSDGDGGGTPGPVPVGKHVIECKVLRRSLESTIGEGVEQTARYMDRCGSREGHLVVFDRREGKTWEEKIFRREESSPDGRTIIVWGV